MSALERVRVGDVLRLRRDEVTIEPDDEYTLIGIYSFGKGIFHRDAKTGAELGDYRFFRVQSGDLVLSNIQAWEGAIAFAGAHDDGTIGTHRFLSYSPVDGSIDPNWARWFFLSEPGMALIRQAAPGTAVRNRTLAVQRFENLVIPLPAVADQRRVAKQLDCVSGITRRLSLKREHASALVTAFAHSCASAQQFTDAEKLRRGWHTVRLEQVLTQSDDRISVTADGLYPNLGIYSFGRGVFSKPPIDGSTTSAKTLWRVRAGQFIYSRLFAFEGAYAVVPDRFDGYYVSNEFPSFDADGKLLDAAWLAAYLRSPQRWEEFGTASVGLGVRRQRVPVESVLAQRVLLPPIEEQREMVRAISRIEAVRERHEHSRVRLTALVPSLLNREFSAHAE